MNQPAGARVTMLPFPKGFSRGTVLGFCGGHAVGRVENARAKTAACWWPDGKPEILALDKQKDVRVARAAGDLIPGCWSNSRTGALGAVVWRRVGHAVTPAVLHDTRYESTWAHGAGGGDVVGTGSPPGKLGHRAPDVGLIWRESGTVDVVASERDVALYCTDGRRVAGSQGGRAALWPSADQEAIDLCPQGLAMGEVQALDGDTQVGVVFQGLCGRAALWRGRGTSFIDLTPAGFETARALGAAGGWHVGFVRQKDTTRNGSTACDDRAALWHGAAEGWIDLNASLPAAYNASVAWAIDANGDEHEWRIGGEASRFEVGDPGTPRESHAVPVAHPVIWTLED